MNQQITNHLILVLIENINLTHTGQHLLLQRLNISLLFFYTFFIIIISLRVASRLVHNIWYEQISHISNVILKYVTIRPPA